MGKESLVILAYEKPPGPGPLRLGIPSPGRVRAPGRPPGAGPGGAACVRHLPPSTRRRHSARPGTQPQQEFQVVY
eukprot:15985-Hanusia_phi.AAC.3